MLRRLLWLLGSVLLAIGMSACVMQAAWATVAQPAGDLVIFDDALDVSFQDWSFDVAADFGVAAPAYNGSRRSIGVTYQAGNWGSLWLVRTGGDVDLTNYTAIRFAIHGGVAGGQSLRIQAGPGTSYPVANEVDLATVLPGGPVANQWRAITVPLSALNLEGGALGSIGFQSNVSTGQPTFYLDDIHLVAGEPTPPPTAVTATIRIQASGTITPVDARILGSNLPSWLGRDRFEDATFRARTAASGLTVLRMPGGSWSNSYGWLSCEKGENQPGALPCTALWAARPTDFVNFLNATGAQGMWIVNPNGTAQEAAAAVAFFNGAVTDERPIGVDIHGTDWRTVGYWAQLRADGGNPESVGVKLWEFGNEVYGGKPSTGGAQCQSWGWEDVWTCDGAEYIDGAGSGATQREGYLAFRAAMRAVDSSILVGAVGYEAPGDPANPNWSNYNNWGIKVIAAAGENLDFYSIHPYAYFELPPNDAAGVAAILAKPQTHWRSIRVDLDAAFDDYAQGRRAPLAATEFNLVSVQDQDNQQLMTRAVNALFLADSIGQAIQNGYAMLNQWDLANGRAANGSEYGLMHEDNGFYRAPQYYVYPLWARFGTEMAPAMVTADPATPLSVYAGKVNDTTLSVLAINKSATPITATIAVDGAAAPVSALVYTVNAATSSAQSVAYNGAATPSDALTEPPASLTAQNGEVMQVLAPWSITLVQVNLDETRTEPPGFRVHLPMVSG